MGIFKETPDLVNIWLGRAVDDGRSNPSSLSSPVWLSRSHPHVRADFQPNFLHTLLSVGFSFSFTLSFVFLNAISLFYFVLNFKYLQNINYEIDERLNRDL